MKAYKKRMNILAKFEGFVMSTILSLVTAITFVNVVVRKLTDGQFNGTIDGPGFKGSYNFADYSGGTMNFKVDLNEKTLLITTE